MLVAACGTPLVTGGEVAASKSNRQPRRGQTQELAPEALTGLYFPSDIGTTPIPGGLLVSGLIECGELLDVMDAGEWTVIERYEIPFWGAVARLVSDERDALVRTTRFDGPSRPDGDETPRESGCSATVTAMEEQRIVMTGAERVDTRALTYPFTCQRDAGRLRMLAIYELEGHGVSFSLEAPDPGIGTASVTDDDDSEFEVASAPMDGSVLSSISTPTEEGESATTEYEPGDDFAGTITLRSTEPLAGTVEVRGLTSDEGEDLSLTATFSCVAGREGQPPEPDVPLVPVDLTVTHEYDTDPDDSSTFGMSGTVVLSGALVPTRGNRSAGTATATGRGTVTVSREDGSGCENPWHGTQRFDVTSEVWGEELTVSFNPVGAADIVFERDCGPNTWEDGNLPVPGSDLDGGSRSLRWAPDDPAARHQVIDESYESGVFVWTVELVPRER